jgi:DNA invertase Pin-like site-specific DNA recombinase
MKGISGASRRMPPSWRSSETRCHSRRSSVEQDTAVNSFAQSVAARVSKADTVTIAAIEARVPTLVEARMLVDPIESRPGFSALLDRIEANGVRTVVVEDASRFARQLIIQEAGIIALTERGVRVLTASGDDLTATEDPFKVAMRQIAGVFAQLEKARLVGKLKAARDRKRATGMKVEGRKSYAEIDA